MKAIEEGGIWAVFATDNYYAGDVIHFLSIRDDVGARSRHSIEIHFEGKEYHIDDKVLRYMNHSFTPNCHITAEGTVFAVKDIYVGDELTFNYLTTESKIQEPFFDVTTGIKVKK